MKTFILATTAAVAMVFAGQNSAQADCYGGYGGYGYGYPSSGFSNPAYGNGGYVQQPVSPWINNPGFGHYDFHNTSHLDYRPTTVVPHYNHLDVRPGGYYLHQTGHYDLHR